LVGFDTNPIDREQSRLERGAQHRLSHRAASQRPGLT
jgi:hypothetical protein